MNAYAPIRKVPLDYNGIEKLLKNHAKVVVLEEHVPHGGLGSRVKEIAFDIKSASEVKCFSLKDKFIHFYGNHTELLNEHGLSADKISNQLLKKS